MWCVVAVWLLGLALRVAYVCRLIVVFDDLLPGLEAKAYVCKACLSAKCGNKTRQPVLTCWSLLR